VSTRVTHRRPVSSNSITVHAEALFRYTCSCTFLWACFLYFKLPV